MFKTSSEDQAGPEIRMDLTKEVASSCKRWMTQPLQLLIENVRRTQLNTYIVATKAFQIKMVSTALAQIIIALFMYLRSNLA